MILVLSSALLTFVLGPLVVYIVIWAGGLCLVLAFLLLLRRWIRVEDVLVPGMNCRERNAKGGYAIGQNYLAAGDA
jgi:hypothetical protein